MRFRITPKQGKTANQNAGGIGNNRGALLFRSNAVDAANRKSAAASHSTGQTSKTHDEILGDELGNLVPWDKLQSELERRMSSPAHPVAATPATSGSTGESPSLSPIERARHRMLNIDTPHSQVAVSRNRNGTTTTTITRGAFLTMPSALQQQQQQRHDKSTGSRVSVKRRNKYPHTRRDQQLLWLRKAQEAIAEAREVQLRIVDLESALPRRRQTVHRHALSALEADSSETSDGSCTSGSQTNAQSTVVEEVNVPCLTGQQQGRIIRALQNDHTLATLNTLLNYISCNDTPIQCDEAFPGKAASRLRARQQSGTSTAASFDPRGMVINAPHGGFEMDPRLLAELQQHRQASELRNSSAGTGLLGCVVDAPASGGSVSRKSRDGGCPTYACR